MDRSRLNLSKDEPGDLSKDEKDNFLMSKEGRKDKFFLLSKEGGKDKFFLLSKKGGKDRFFLLSKKGGMDKFFILSKAEEDNDDLMSKADE